MILPKLYMVTRLKRGTKNWEEKDYILAADMEDAVKECSLDGKVIKAEQLKVKFSIAAMANLVRKDNN